MECEANVAWASAYALLGLLCLAILVTRWTPFGSRALDLRSVLLSLAGCWFGRRAERSNRVLAMMPAAASANVFSSPLSTCRAERPPQGKPDTTLHRPLAETLDRVNDGFVAFDPEMNYTFVNRRAGELLGRNPEDLIGKNYWTEYPEAAGSTFAEAYLRALETLQPMVIEDYYAPFDRWFENRIYPSESGLSVFFSDITDEKKLREALRQSEEKFRTVFENSPDSIIVTRVSDGLTVEVNDRFSALTGYAEEDAIGRRFDDLNLWANPDDLRAVTGRLHETGRVRDFEFERKLKNGQIRNAQVSVARCLIDGEPHLIWTVRDIHDRKLAELALQAARDQLERRVAKRTEELEEANDAMKAFVYSVSHDLRAPLRAINGFAEILAQSHRADLDDEGQHFLDNIVQASGRMRRLIDDLLAYARLGTSAIRNEPVLVADLIAEIVGELRPRLDKLHACVDIAADLPPLIGNSTLLRGVFLNLIENGVSYNRPEVPPRVEIGWTRDDGHVTIHVRDNGVGIPAEHMDKIFRVFQRLQSADDHPGTGIGLAIVRRSVALLGGDVWVESQVGEGSTFFVRLTEVPG